MKLSILKKCVHFDHINGIATNLFSTEHNVIISNKINLQYYPRIKIDGKNYLIHRLAWMDYYSIRTYDLLPKCIDHINRNKTDYRINNLREVSISENNKNRDKFSDVAKYGKCVYYNDIIQKYVVKIVFDNQIQYSEIFDDLTTAQHFVKIKFEIHAPWFSDKK